MRVANVVVLTVVSQSCILAVLTMVKYVSVVVVWAVRVVAVIVLTRMRPQALSPRACRPQYRSRRGERFVRVASARHGCACCLAGNTDVVSIAATSSVQDNASRGESGDAAAEVALRLQRGRARNDT